MFREGISFSFAISLVVLMVTATLVKPAECSGFPNVEASQGKIWPQPQVILEGEEKNWTNVWVIATYRLIFCTMSKSLFDHVCPCVRKFVTIIFHPINKCY